MKYFYNNKNNYINISIIQKLFNFKKYMLRFLYLLKKYLIIQKNLRIISSLLPLIPAHILNNLEMLSNSIQILIVL